MSSGESTDCTGRDSARRGKPVIMLSRVDRERLERGDISCPEEAFAQYDYRPPTQQELADKADRSIGREKRGLRSCASQPTLSPLDKDIIANIPPHFGKI